MQWSKAVCLAALITCSSSGCSSSSETEEPEGASLSFARIEQAAGQCLDQPLPADADGGIPCVAVEARQEDGSCVCGPQQVKDPLQTGATELQQAIAADPTTNALGLNCFCEVAQLVPPEREVCQQDTSDVPEYQGQPIHGWCYIDREASPPIGNSSLTDGCSPSPRRILRLVNEGKLVAGSTLWLGCPD